MLSSRMGMGIAHDETTSGPADVTKPPMYLGFISNISANPERLGFSGELLVPKPVTYPTVPFIRHLVPIPIVASPGSLH
jgi:hypothetical protein